MSIEEIVVDRLQASSVVAIVGTRIRPDVPAEDPVAMPLLVYTRTGTQSLGCDSDYFQYTFQFDYWSPNASVVTAIGSALIEDFDRWRNRTIGIDGSFLEEQSTTPEDQGYHGVSTFRIFATA